MQAADLIRGLGGGSFSTQGKQKGKGTINVVAQAGAKVSLSKEERSGPFAFVPVFLIPTFALGQ